MGNLSWTRLAPFQFDASVGIVDVMRMAWQEWEHIIRENARRMVWKEAAKRRRDMQGIEDGIDHKAIQGSC